MFTADEQAMLRAVMDRLLPGDDAPSATGFGADRYVLAMLDGDAAPLRELIRYGLDDLRVAGFLTRDAAGQDALLRETAAAPWLKSLIELTAEGAFADPTNGGNRDAAAWKMLGYAPGLPDGPDGPPRQPTPPPGVYGPSEVTDWDVIIIGSGAGGGSAAGVLAAAGKKVLVLERGRLRSYADSGHRDHLRNHRVFTHGHNTGPELDGNPRIFVDPLGFEHLVAPHQNGFQPLASAVGGGTLVYGMQAWRFQPTDFRMASQYGVPEGSSLADWPIAYEDLEPWYDRAEWEIGVAGTPGGDPNGGPRQRDYPMPPLPSSPSADTLRRGADRLGIRTFAVPLLLNSAPRDGRPACIQCGTCIGFPCPVDAKNGSQNTHLRRALASGNCTLITGIVADRIATDARGKVIGVEVIHDDGRREQLRAKAVVVAAAAVETARLLLLSANAQEPDGLGNRSRSCRAAHAGALLPRRLWPLRGRGRHLARAGAGHRDDRLQPWQSRHHRRRHAGRRFRLHPDDVLADAMARRRAALGRRRQGLDAAQFPSRHAGARPGAGNSLAACPRRARFPRSRQPGPPGRAHVRHHPCRDRAHRALHEGAGRGMAALPLAPSRSGAGSRSLACPATSTRPARRA